MLVVSFDSFRFNSGQPAQKIAILHSISVSISLVISVCVPK